MLEVAVLYGCDLSQVFTPIILRLYQPHSLCEKAALVVFLLPPLREGRPGRTRTSSTAGVFLLAPLREGRPAQCVAAISAAIFLLAPLREGRHHGLLHCCRLCLISTRAPTRGATRFGAIFVRHIVVFLLTPLREGRPA